MRSGSDSPTAHPSQVRNSAYGNRLELFMLRRREALNLTDMQKMVLMASPLCTVGLMVRIHPFQG